MWMMGRGKGKQQEVHSEVSRHDPAIGGSPLSAEDHRDARIDALEAEVARLRNAQREAHEIQS